MFQFDAHTLGYNLVSQAAEKIAAINPVFAPNSAEYLQKLAKISREAEPVTKNGVQILASLGNIMIQFDQNSITADQVFSQVTRVYHESDWQKTTEQYIANQEHRSNLLWIVYDLIVTNYPD